MSEKGRTEKYSLSISQLKGVLTGEDDFIANLSNAAAILAENLGFFWVGFYLVKKDELVLGPFQGPVACTRIQKGKGVCGTSWAENKSILVPDVHEFPGHIACSALSESEIVIPLRDSKNIPFALLDVDSERKADFSDLDLKSLEAFTAIIEAKHA